MRATLQTIDYALLQQCMHCGMCLPTCPTYDATGRERNSPRGRIALMRAVADGELQVSQTFADEMSYCLGCLACQTACPAGVNYAVLFETARSDIQDAGVSASVKRRFWTAVTLRFLFMRPRALRAAGRLLRLVQKSRLDVLARRTGLTRLLPADLRRLEPQAPRVADAFSRHADRAPGITGRHAALSCRPADRLRPGSGVPGHQSRHRGCAAREWMRRRDAVAAAMLRLAPRAQRRAGDGGGARAAPDRSDSSRSLRRDHHERGRMRLAPAALFVAARRRPSISRSGAAVGREAARHSGMAGGNRMPGAEGVALRAPDRGHVPRVVPSGARPEGLAAAPRAAAAVAGCRLERAPRIDVVLWQRRHLRAYAARSGGSSAHSQGRAHPIAPAPRSSRPRTPDATCRSPEACSLPA